MAFKKKWEDAQPLDTTLKKAKEDDILELDELWSFIRLKLFDRWIWIAICRRTRQVVAYHIGSRKTESCKEFWDKIPAEYKHCITFSDFWEAYQKVITTGKHYSVGKESGETAHVERWNNTLRQRLSRFVRKTLSFSKNELMHEVNTFLFIFRYNLELSLTS